MARQIVIPSDLFFFDRSNTIKTLWYFILLARTNTIYPRNVGGPHFQLSYDALQNTAVATFGLKIDKRGYVPTTEL